MGKNNGKKNITKRSRFHIKVRKMLKTIKPKPINQTT